MQFLDERNRKLISCIRELIYSQELPVTPIRVMKVGELSGGPKCPDGRQWEQLGTDLMWGGDNEYYWFAADIVIPPGYEGKTAVLELTTGQEGKWDATNPQFLVYINGRPKQGLDINHREIILTENAAAGEKYSLRLSAFTGVLNFRLLMDLKMKVLNREMETFYYDLDVLQQVKELLDSASPEAIAIGETLNNTLDMVDFRKPGSERFFDSVRRAETYLNQEFYQKACGNSRETVYAVGHTHIDVAWMWTLAVTRDKAVRSFATVLELMRQYPEYIFMSSQPQLYKYVKEKEPELYQEIRERVREGRWEAEGGMFVEADCNLASGEALVRQFVMGKKFFMEEFQKDNKILWLPDVFGYSAALPQIMKKCGIDYFMTTKISWSETNKMPNDTFLWQGIDGTEVLTHFICTKDFNPPALVEGKKRPPHFTTYNGYLNPSQVKGAWKRYSQKELNPSILMCYGYGDGGGGTTRDMLENQRRLAKGILGCPKTKVSTALEFFQNLEGEVAGKKELPKWVGELYLEYHRGTYTSMARNKRFNRRAEFALLNLESDSTAASRLLGIGYPKKELEGLWEILLRNQFHDILPGSSIQQVYEDSREEYEQLFAQCAVLEKQRLSELALHVEGKAGDIIVLNRNGFDASDYVYIDYPNLKKPTAFDGEHKSPIQPTADGKGIFLARGIPSKGYQTYEIVEGEEEETAVSLQEDGIETDYLRIRWNRQGCLTSIYDRTAGRELLKEGCCANELITYEDRPHNYDAWDINEYYTRKEWKVDAEPELSIAEHGTVRTVLHISRRYLDSKIEQDLVFYHNDARIDIVNRIDWREENLLLRTYLPVDIHAGLATYEIQYGNVQRPTHYNTSWEQAKFEVCAHKWVDLSEDGYGVSVLNDSKYGCDIHNGVIGLTMLKSACYPNPAADKELHEFSYSIRPHRGGWRESGTLQKAYAFNNPLAALKKEKGDGCLPQRLSMCRTDCENIVIEALKAPEQGEGIILRLYEAFNRRVKAKVTFYGEIESAFECDMLEKEEKKLEICKNSAEISMRPYEIKTLKVYLKPG